MSQKQVPCFSSQQLESLCRVLGDAVTGTELGRILQEMNIPESIPANAKWKRLFNALATMQDHFHHGNHTINFIHRVFDPVKWTEKKEEFNQIKVKLNKVLAFCGYQLYDDGKIHPANKASSIYDAERRADKLKTFLKERNVHPDVLEFCNAELLADNYFHAVLEATKSIANKIRKMSGLGSDGAALVDEAFSFSSNGIPLIAINLLTTDTEKSEQKGFMNLLKGLFGTFRNTTAHAEKIYWSMTEEDALDILGIVSLVHRKLDKSYSNKELLANLNYRDN
jgi:uncharacterized protein (TIGR02391 family)